MTTPWWDCLRLRPEIAKAGGNINDVQMSLYRAVHQPDDTVYADVGYYSDITHPTAGLLELMGSIAVRMAAPTNYGSVKAVWRGDQGMGGGKSHAEVGLFHMADSPDEFFATDLGRLVQGHAQKISGESLPADLDNPAVVVLPCDRMDPFKPDKKVDNIAESLGERWLWRLFDRDVNKYDAYVDRLGTPDGISEAMAATGRPVLTLIDEILNYVRKATADEAKTDRAQQDIAFLRDLMDATNSSDHAALVLVMIASDVDTVAMGEFGESIREELDGMLQRFGRPIATTSGGDFAAIIRRRLFDRSPPAEVVTAAVDTYRQHVVGSWSEQFAPFSWWTDGLADEVERAYPFHPALIDLVEREWSSRAGFQRVRSTIQIFAATVHAWLERAKAGEWAPPLIGLGDLPLSESRVREALLNSGVIPDTKNQTNYREIAANDVVDLDDKRGTARRIDVDRTAGKLLEVNPRVAERMATAMWMCSLAPRVQGAVGATEAELRVAGFVPDSDCNLAEIDAVLATLEAPDGIATLDVKPGKGGQPRRLLMSTTQTLQMFFRSQRASITDDEVNTVMRDLARAEMKAGPFDRLEFVSAEGHVDLGMHGDDLTNALLGAIDSAGLDDASTRLIVLDPAAYTLLNGQDSETRIAISAALKLNKPAGWNVDLAWPTPLSHVYPSSAIYVLVNTQRRKQVVEAARDYIGWQRVSEIASVSADPSLSQQAKANVAARQAATRERLRKAYQHIVYLGEDRTAVTRKLDGDVQTGLDGHTVWLTLANSDKAFGQGEFDRVALEYQLDERHWNKSLSSLRADFYRDPRLPLLWEGDTDLKNALFAATRASDPKVVIKDAAGDVVEAGSPADINLTSDRFQLAPYETVVLAGEPAGDWSAGSTGGDVEATEQGGGTTVAGTEAGPRVEPPSPSPPTSTETKVSISLMGSTFSEMSEKNAANLLFDTIAALVDSGKVSFGKFQIELDVDADRASAIIQAARDLGASAAEREL
jgi:hypothetical protein